MAQSTVVDAAAAVRDRPRVDHWFHIGVALLVILIAVAGFGPSIVDGSQRNGPATPLVIAHGAVASAWLLLFLTQATLVATGRTDVHRRLGLAGPVLALVLIVLGFVLSLETTRRTFDLSGDLVRAAGGPFTPDGILFGMVALFNFGVLVAAALWFRHRPEIHKRLMVLAVIQPLAGEPIGHLTGYLTGRFPALDGAYPVIAVVSMILLLSISAVHDRVSQGRIHPVSLWVPLALFVWVNVLIVVVLPSAMWLTLATWLIH